MLCSIASLTIILSVTWRIERLSLLFVSPTERRRNGDYNDKNIIHLPRQDKRVDCIFPQRGAVLGQITAYKKARYYGIATNEVLEPKI